jgi:phosphate transport system permease protein
VVILAVLLVRLIADGFGALDWEFWSTRFSPLGLKSGGPSGIFDSLQATLTVLGITMLFAIPVGTAAGIYLHEYAGRGRLSDFIRATVANLASVPSVIYGLLGLAIFVRLLMFGATNLSSALTLGVLILPILIVATEEALKTVPQPVRDASLAMGATKWQTIRYHVLPYSLPGILTGQILALSRAAGETAPLAILTIPTFSLAAGGGLFDPGAPLSLRAYTLATDPNAFARLDAAGAIVALLLVTLTLNLAAIIVRQRLSRKIKW